MEERLPIKEAAERLGVSADTVRRRLKRGELTGEKEETPQGFVWRVELPAAETPPEAPGAPQTTPGETIELAQLRERVAGLERLTEELMARREEIAVERESWKEAAQRESEAARELRVLLRQAQMLALPQETARQDAPGATEEPSRVSGDSQEKGAVRRLWHWLRGGSTT